MRLGRALNRLVQPTLDRLRAPKRAAFYRQFIGERKQFFDIGANVGNRTMAFRQLGVRVVAVEPQTDVAAVLRKKFASDPDVIVVNKGLGEAEGESVIHICTSANAISTFSPEWKQGRFSVESFDREERVPMTTLDALIREHGVPDFCKIDVEGYEFQVLQGLSSKIPALSFEFTSEYQGRAEEIVDLLRGRGFSSFAYSLGENLMLIGGWVSGDRLIESIRHVVKRDRLAWGDIYTR